MEKPKTRLSVLIGAVVTVTFACVLLVEISLRALCYVGPLPLRTLLSEARRIPLSNSRVRPGRTAISLPETTSADIVVIGDSLPFGTYVEGKDTFPAVLGETGNLSVVNLGAGSQGPPFYNRMMEIGARYHPKLFIYCVFSNDFKYLDPPPVRELSSENTFRSLPGDGEGFELTWSPKDRLLWALRSFTNLSLGYQLRKLFSGSGLTNEKSHRWNDEGLFFVFVDKGYWDANLDLSKSYVKQGLDSNVALTKAASAFAAKHSAKFLVVMIPHKEMVYADSVGELKSSIYSASHHELFLQYQRQLTEKGIEVLDLTPSLRALAGRKVKLYHSIDGHLDERGHREVASILLSKISPVTKR